MMSVRQHGTTFQIDWTKGRDHILRRALGTRNRDAAVRLRNRLENAVAEGPNSPQWLELAAALPPRTYMQFAKLVGVKETKAYTWDDLVLSFSNRMTYRIQIGKFREPTAKRYRSVIREFQSFLKEPQRDISVLRDMQDEELFDKFKIWRLERVQANGGNGRGIDTEVRVLHTVFQHAVDKKMIDRNPVKLESAHNENSGGGTDPYSGDELLQLGEHAGEDLLPHLLLRHTGFRESDAVFVTFREVDFRTKELDRVTLKRGKRVILPIHPELMAALIAERERRKAMPDDPILLNARTGRPFRPATLYAHIKALGKRAGVTDACPRRFRATFSVDLLHRGASIADVAQALGDTEKVVKNHYVKYIPELRQRLRSFIENDKGMDEKHRDVFPEKLAQQPNEYRQWRPNEQSKSQSTWVSEIAQSSGNNSASMETAPEKNLAPESSAVSAALATIPPAAPASAFSADVSDWPESVARSASVAENAPWPTVSDWPVKLTPWVFRRRALDC